MKQPMDKSQAKKNVVSSQTVVEKLIVLGKKQGYLTYDEVNNHIPPDLFGPDQIDGILQTLGRRNFRLVATKEDLATPESTAATKKVDTAKDKKDDSEAYRTNDPVRMYLRKMGAVALLTREGEIEIAKRIETAENKILDTILNTHVFVVEILDVEEQLRESQINIKEVVRGLEVDEEGLPAPDAAQTTRDNVLIKLGTVRKLFNKNIKLEQKIESNINDRVLPRFEKSRIS